jgi:endonuclease I
MKKTQTLGFLILFTVSEIAAQIPPGYYDPAYGKSGEALQQALHDIVQTNISVDYSSVWTCFEMTDKRPNNSVWDIYSDIEGSAPPYIYHFGVDQCGSSGGASVEDACYDREHSWPKSWFGGEVYPMYSDLFILYPADSYVNGRRSNYPYGPVAHPLWTSKNGSKLGSCAWTGYSGKVFEPIDEFKGDLARTYFYISVRYYQDDPDWPGSAMTIGSQLKTWALAMMLQWNSIDPVSQKETDRNNAVYHIQGNRNPFIDHPEYAGVIWSNGTGIQESDHVTIRIFPNPAHDYCYLTIPRGFNPADYTVRLTALNGIMVKIFQRRVNNSFLLDIHDLQDGVYFVIISGAGALGNYNGKIFKD